MSIKSKVGEMADKVSASLTENKPGILLGVAIAAIVVTPVLSVLATKKVLPKIQERKDDRYEETGIVKCKLCGEEIPADDMEKHIEQKHAAIYPMDVDDIWDYYKFPISFKDALQVSWKYYVPVLASVGLGITSMIFSNKELIDRSTLLAMALQLSEHQLDEYRDYRESTKEIVGKAKENDIYTKTMEKKLEKTPYDAESVLSTGNGNYLCFDALCGRYFRCDFHLIERAVDELNVRLDRMCRSSMDSQASIMLGEFYDILNLPEAAAGNLMCWKGHIDDRNNLVGAIKLQHSSIIHPVTHEPAYVVDFAYQPRSEYVQ